MKTFVRFLAAVSTLLFSFSVAQAVELTISERSNIDRIDEPVTCGVPLPQGWASLTRGLVLSVEGQETPAEFRAVDYWPDGSLRWVHLDFQTSVKAGGALKLNLEKGTPGKIDSKLKVEEADGKITVTTGRLKAEVIGRGFNVFNGIWLAGTDGSYASQLVAPHERGLVMWAGGVEYCSAKDNSSELKIESRGPMRTVLRAEGVLKSGSGGQGFNYICRLYFYNDSPVVRVVFTFENRGPYERGREDKVTLEGLHVEIPTAGKGLSCLLGLPDQDQTVDLTGTKEASLAVPSSDKLVLGRGQETKTVADPKALKSDRIGWIGMSTGAGGGAVIGMGLRDFWQMHPSSLEASSVGLLTAGLVPHRLGAKIDIYSGVARTHYLRFAFLGQGEGDRLRSMVASCQRPLLALASPVYYCRESRAFGKIVERNLSLYPPVHRQMVQQVEERMDQGLEVQLQYVENRTKSGVTVEGYGFLHWGDAMHHIWVAGLNDPRNIAWNGHYYDLPYMAVLEYVRSGQWRYLDHFLSRSYHQMDVHLTHFEPGNFYNGANRYDPPTDHVRIDPGRDPLNAKNVYVSNSTNHHKTQGLFTRYCLTGDERALESALKALNFANAFGAYSDFSQPRGAAHQVLTLIKGYQITGDKKYLNTARTTFELWLKHFESTEAKFTNGFFMVGFLLEGFIDYYEVTGDRRVVEFVHQAVDWMHQNRPQEINPNMSLANGFLAKELGNPEYTELEKKHLANWSGVHENAFKDYANNGRSLARALYYLTSESQGQ